MKRKFLFLSPISLILLAAMQLKMSKPNATANSTVEISRGGELNMISSNANTPIHIPASLSADMAAHGIKMQFVSATDIHLFPGKILNKTFHRNFANQSLHQENTQSKFIFESCPGYIGFFNPTDPAVVNHEFYEQSFSSLLMSFNNENEDKPSHYVKLSAAKMVRHFTIAKEKEIRAGISVILKKNIEGESCDSTAMNCSWDPRGFIFDSADIIKTGKVYYGKYQPDTIIPNFNDVAYEADNINELTDDYDIDDEILPACPTEYSCSQIGKSLYYYLYYPKLSDTNCSFPVVILFHAGGFSDCSQLNYEDDICRMIARKGFIVINVEYRRGRIKDEDNTADYTSVQQIMANYRAFQDGRGAVRTVIFDQRNISTNHIPYRIDTSKIFIAGHSAGAMIATSLCFFTTQAQIDSVFPSPAGKKKISTALGQLDADFYRGTPDIEFHSKIKALWCMWGAIPIPKKVSDLADEYNFLTRNDSVPLIPTISFMGAKDDVFPPKKNDQYVYYPPDDHPTYTTETGCMINSPFELSSNNNKKQFRLECTNDLYKILKAHGVPAMMFIDCDMKHGLEHNPDKSAPLSTNFNIVSVTPTTLAVINNYMSSRFTFFARKVNNGTAGSLLGPSKFIDCEDRRHNCSNAPDHETCTSSTCTTTFEGE